LILLSLNACTTATEYRLRPVDLQVLDAQTDKPLRDITVYQIIESEVYGGCIKIFPKLEPTDHHYVAEVQKTDKNGSVAFINKQLKLACSEHIAHEYLIINIDLKPGVYESDLARLSISRAGALVHFGISSLKDYQEQYTAILNDHYRGYVIYGAEYQMGSDWFHGRQKLFDVVTNGQGLLATSQSFTVRLESTKTY
jgi:hypothetical protein